MTTPPGTSPPALATDPAPPATTASEPARTSAKLRLVVAVKTLLFLIVCYFVGVALVRQFRTARWEDFHFHPGLAALAVLCMLGVSAVQLLMFRTLLAAYGYRLSWPATLGIAWVPPLGKYVPGKVAAVAGAVYLQRQHGVPGAVAVSVAVMLDGLAVIAGLLFSAPLLVWHDSVRQRFPTAWIWCGLLAVLGLAALHPRVFVALLNVLLQLARRQPLKVVPSLGRFVIPVLAAFAQWVYAGLGLWLMTRAVTDVAVTDIPLFIATAALAMTVSYLALFAPGGLGVREALYLLVLGPVVAPPAAVGVVVVAMRVVQTLIEVTLAALGMTALRAARQDPPRAAPAAPPTTASLEAKTRR